MKRVRDDHRIHRLAVLVEQVDGREGNVGPGGAPHRDLERIVAHNLEFKRAVVDYAVEGSPVGIGDFLRRQQDRFQQPVDVGFLGQRDADLSELLQTLEQIGGIPGVLHLVHGAVFT